MSTECPRATSIAFRPPRQSIEIIFKMLDAYMMHSNHIKLGIPVWSIIWLVFPFRVWIRLSAGFCYWLCLGLNLHLLLYDFNMSKFFILELSRWITSGAPHSTTNYSKVTRSSPSLFILATCITSHGHILLLSEECFCWESFVDPIHICSCDSRLEVSPHWILNINRAQLCGYLPCCFEDSF